MTTSKQFIVINFAMSWISTVFYIFVFSTLAMLIQSICSKAKLRGNWGKWGVICDLSLVVILRSPRGRNQTNPLSLRTNTRCSGESSREAFTNKCVCIVDQHLWLIYWILKFIQIFRSIWILESTFSIDKTWSYTAVLVSRRIVKNVV